MHTTQSGREPRERELRAHAVGHLESLALAHREGRLTLEAYRKLRAPLIDVLDEAAGHLECATIPDLQNRAYGSRRAAAPPRSGWRNHLRRLVMVVAGTLFAVAACSPLQGP
jgi:hypothetical protein